MLRNFIVLYIGLCISWYGCFSVVLYVCKNNENKILLTFHGLEVYILSMAGIPIFAGFFALFYFDEMIQSGFSYHCRYQFHHKCRLLF
jgi:NADH:ubiquinone oxidoreductase subunit 2 (subunit N)